MQLNPTMPTTTEADFSHTRVSMALIIDILRASRELFYFSSALRLQSPANLSMLINLLTRMGETLHELFEKLEAGQLPKATCYKLEQLSYQLHVNLEPMLGKMRAQALSDKFIQTHRIDLLYRELALGMDAHALILLQAAANHLLDTANKLKVPA